MKRPEFTKEQEHWICDVLDDWYLFWKGKMCDYKTETHRLGIAKEQLKEIICDDGEMA